VVISCSVAIGLRVSSASNCSSITPARCGSPKPSRAKRPSHEPLRASATPAGYPRPPTREPPGVGSTRSLTPVTRAPA
jgi:hypothetical protein